MRPRRALFFHSGRSRSTKVSCPECGAALIVQRGCLATTIACVGACQRRYQLSELVALLDEQSFALLAEAVGDHLADRV